jgi:antirestriction protein ArdC
MMKVLMSEYRDNLVKKMIKAIENGTAPWQKPWEPGRVRVHPFNPVSGARYRGMNLLLLQLAATEKGYNDPRWMTLKQANRQDAKVRRGEKSTVIEYWEWYSKIRVLDGNGQPKKDKDGKDIKKKGQAKSTKSVLRDGF